MKRSFLRLLVLLIIATLMLAGCGGAAPTAEAPKEEAKATEAPKEEAKATEAPKEEAPKEESAPASEATGTVTLWHAYQTGSSEEATLTELVGNAQKQFPGLKIDVLQIPFDQIFNKWQTEVAAGEGPDMFIAPNDDLGNMSRASLVAPLDEYLAGKLDGVSEVAVEGMKVDGVLYGVPESAKAVALYYNKELVKEAPKTTEELLAAVKGGVKMTSFIGAYHMFGWSGSFGGKLMDGDGKCVADQGGWSEALQYFLDLKAAGATFNADYGVAEAPFRSGEAAFFVNGPWALADYKKDLGDKLGVMPIPEGTSKASPFNGIDGFYVNPNSSNIQGAVDLALFLTNKESAQIYTDKAGHVPIRSDVKAADPLVAVFAEASANGFPRPQSVKFANYWAPFGDMFTKAIEGASTPADAVKEACAAMNAANEGVVEESSTTEESATEEEASTEETTNLSGTVTLWHAYQTGSSEEATLTELVGNAQKQFPELKIDVLQIPFDQIFNKWQTEVAAGEGPDMFIAPNDDLGNMSRASLVAPLDEYLAGKLDGVSEVAVEGMKVDGVLYGVPESAKAVALYYNKELVKEAPKTTEELLAAVKGGAKMTSFIGAYHMFGWSGSFGGKLMDGDGKCVADQGGWSEALQYFLDLKAAGATFNADYGVAEAPFRSGEAAFFVNGPWALADYKKDLGDKLGVVPIPEGTSKASPFNGIDGFYVNPNSSNIQGAVDLALFLTNKESAQIYTDKAGHVPIRSDVKAADPLVAVFAEASANGFPRPQSVEFANYWAPFGDMFTKAIEGASTPADAVKEACAAMNTANSK